MTIPGGGDAGVFEPDGGVEVEGGRGPCGGAGVVPPGPPADAGVCGPGAPRSPAVPPRGVERGTVLVVAAMSSAFGENFALQIRGAVICVWPIGAQSPVKPMNVKPASAVGWSSTGTPSG